MTSTWIDSDCYSAGLQKYQHQENKERVKNCPVFKFKMICQLNLTWKLGYKIENGKINELQIA